MNFDYTLEENLDRMLQASRERGFQQVVITKELVQRLRREFGLTKNEKDHEDNGTRHGNNCCKRRKHTRNMRNRLEQRKRRLVNRAHKNELC